ncbi:MAG: adenosylhomocysteinase [Euryarchaeota archaeon]|nr:adenosylhomocysteinase [Euryarchaeota archaeon]
MSADKALADKGALRLEWARAHMDVLADVRQGLIKSKVLKGLRIGMALHVEAKTGVLALTLQEAGAKVRLTSCNPLSTDDSVAVALNERYKLDTRAKKWQSNKEYYESLHRVLDIKPQITIDDGGDLIFLLHTERRELLDEVIGANEETTTGIIRLRAMHAEGALKFPVMAVNNASMKYLFDNRYGTGQSTMDGILNATNLLVAGRAFVVAGYGWCGRGIAMRARGMGARVVVTEIDPTRAVEAHLDGFEVAPMAEAVKKANFIVTATGCRDIITAEHIANMKDGCVMANSGHFDNEISKDALKKASKTVKRVREFVDEYALGDGRKLYLLAEGRLVNLAAGQGHPVEIMDMSFAIQALCAGHLAKNGRRMKPGVYDVPRELDGMVAKLALSSHGIEIDSLSKRQKEYLTSWREGT